MPDAIAPALDLEAKHQAFESGIFGAPVWRLTLNEQFGREDLEETLNRARAEGVALISCRLDENSACGMVLKDAGFRYIERLVTFSRPLDDGPRVAADVAAQEDAEACAKIARDVFSYDRYHADPQVPDTIANEVKRQWVLNGVRGRADAPIVIRADGAVVGFNLCLRRGDTAVIDLIGVAGGYQGRGFGRRLIQAALSHYAGQCEVMTVGTQDINLASVALYEGEGFRAETAAVTYHWTP